MVEVNGEQVCIAEYFDACIGAQKVVDVIQEGKTIWYVFQDGHAVPLLCFCCGEPLSVADFDEERRDVVGRRLAATSASLVQTDDGEEHVKFFLELSPKRLFSEELSVPLST